MISEGYGSQSHDLIDIASDGCIYWAWGGSYTQIVIKLLSNGQVSVEDEYISKPSHSIIAYPNPFNSSTTIAFSLLDEGMVRLSVYNIRGQKVKDLINSNMIRGFRKVIGTAGTMATDMLAPECIL